MLEIDAALDELQRRYSKTIINSERMVRVLRLRYCDGLTYREIGKRENVTGSRARQITEKARVKLLRISTRAHNMLTDLTI